MDSKHLIDAVGNITNLFDGKVDLAEITAAVDKAEAKVEEVKAVVKKARKPKAK
jgi:hypothetical protein